MIFIYIIFMMYLKKYFIVVFFFVLLIETINAKEICQPDLNLETNSEDKLKSNPADKNVEDKTKSSSTDKNPVFVFFDGSLSMQGYVKDQLGQKNLYRDVIDDLQQISENVGKKTFYHRFGSKIEPIKENEIAKATKPDFYACSESQAECNNQETRLELAFKAANANKDATYIIVTDLFLSNKQLVGSTLGSITNPLKTILKNGKSIGIFGIMSSFNGNIYDIPKKNGGTFQYNQAKKRPFYIIVIGDQKNINQIRKNLEEQHFIDAEDQYKFTLITSSPVLQNLNKNKIITADSIVGISKSENFKFEYTGNNLPVYKFDTNSDKKIEFKIKLSEIIVPGSSIDQYILKENLWSSSETRCEKINDWKKTKYKDISILQANENDLVINLFKGVPLKKLFGGMRHFYTVSVYANQTGNLSEETFKDWSIRDSDAEEFTDQSPVEFKTLNLTKIIKILTSVANETFEPTLIATIALNMKLEK